MMNCKRITITKPPLHATLTFCHIELIFSFNKTVIDFEFGYFETFTISFLVKLFEIRWTKTMLLPNSLNPYGGFKGTSINQTFFF